MKAIFISHYYKRNPENALLEVPRYAIEAWKQGGVPIVPHWLFPPVAQEADERTDIMAGCLELVSRCDELWACGPIVTDGMEAEIAQAKRL